MTSYNYERDSIPCHVQRVRDLRATIAEMQAEIRHPIEPVPYWYVARFKARKRELAEVLTYRGVREALGE